MPFQKLTLFIDSGNGSDVISYRYNNGSDVDLQGSSTQRRRSRRDKHAGNEEKQQNFRSNSRLNEREYPSENSSNGDRSKDKRRRRRSRVRQSATQSLPPLGKPGSTTTRSTASIEDDYKNRNNKRSVSLRRVDEKFDRGRNKNQSYSRYDENDNADDIENNYYTQLKIGNTDIVSKKRTPVPYRRKITSFSRHLPAVADYKPDEYKSKRGLSNNVKLPPMSQSPSGRTFSTSDPSSLSSNGSYGPRGVRKPRQLEPLESDIATFDSKKHRKRTQKLVEQRYR